MTNRTRAFLAIHALSLMHGSTILLDGGRRVRLLPGFANRRRHLEVKVEIAFAKLPKPPFVPISVFSTDLSPDEHCEPRLLTPSDSTLPDHWDFPIHVG